MCAHKEEEGRAVETENEYIGQSFTLFFVDFEQVKLKKEITFYSLSS